MKLTSELIKQKAKEIGVDCIAVGNIERFKARKTNEADSIRVTLIDFSGIGY